MKHQSKARYPAPAAIVLKMFADPKFHTGKLDKLGFKYRVLDQKNAGGEFSIRIERKVPMDAPGIVKKFVPLETTVVNEEAWNLAAKTGRVKVQPQGIPVDCSCKVTIKDEGSGCVITYDWEINARVPLVGGTLEKFIVGDMDKRAGDETALGIKMVEAYR
jgi:hypothetical protein